MEEFKRLLSALTRWKFANWKYNYVGSFFEIDFALFYMLLVNLFHLWAKHLNTDFKESNRMPHSLCTQSQTLSVMNGSIKGSSLQ